MSLAWVRKYYGVPAKRGGRVEYTGDGKLELGTITGTCSGHLRVRLDGVKHTMPFHPTWELRYLDAPQSPAAFVRTLADANSKDDEARP
jgi:hypothetical protein